jgi:hypothetical protein
MNAKQLEKFRRSRETERQAEVYRDTLVSTELDWI